MESLDSAFHAGDGSFRLSKARNRQYHVGDLQCIQIGFDRNLTERIIALRIDGSNGVCSGRKKPAVVTTAIRDWESGFSSTALGRQSSWRYR
jgi:hypothetical protein